ncbi:MAG: nucleotide exchange factor GrpE [Oscillospiraceae bacterium]|nr:nucleotide exchange factor GrpE [Oscillospiraceae bacterium]
MSKKKQDNAPEEEAREQINETEAPVEEASAAEPDEKDALINELAAEKDKYLRLLAEYDNFRKRSQKEREALYTDVKADTILKLLPVYDNLERALKQETTDEAFYKGVEMTMTQLLDIFDKLGVKAIPAEGEKFDPERHNAVTHIEDDSFGENTVAEEFQKGFMLGEKVIRFSMVKVAN